jgi:preprotein translocase subunit SecD
MFPTIQWYYLLDESTKNIVSSSKELIRDESERQAQVIVEELIALVKTKPEDLFPVAKYGHVVDGAKKLYEKAKLPLPATWTNKSVMDIFPADVDPATKQDMPTSSGLFDVVAAKIRDYYLDMKVQKTRIIQLGLDLQGGISVVLRADTTRLEESRKANGQETTDQDRQEALDFAVETLKGRIDSFGVAEASVRTDPANMRITVDLPGDQDKERVNSFLIGGGSLRLQLVNVEANQAFQDFLVQFRAQNSGRNWNMDDLATLPEGLIPAGNQIRPVMIKDDYGIDKIEGYQVTREEPDSVVEGTSIVSATPDRDQTGRPVATFKLDGAGAEKFQKITRDNVGKPLAIVVDGRLKGVPINIAAEISGGNVQITGFEYDEALAIAKVLRSGSLPVDLAVEGTNNVGASLGEDRIKSGTLAAIVGIGLVLLFMLMYYLGSGFVANVALVLNFFLLVAALSTIGFTLTLTSIAGLVLTVGMAVDANVIIFERIKEEIAIGKTRGAAIKTGYGKALWAIVDSNITTIIASILLASFGTGPIRGFAVTLTIGIVTSMFTALFVTRLLQDFGTEQLGQTRMSISWRRK